MVGRDIMVLMRPVRSDIHFFSCGALSVWKISYFGQPKQMYNILNLSNVGKTYYIVVWWVGSGYRVASTPITIPSLPFWRDRTSCQKVFNSTSQMSSTCFGIPPRSHGIELTTATVCIKWRNHAPPECRTSKFHCPSRPPPSKVES